MKLRRKLRTAGTMLLTVAAILLPAKVNALTYVFSFEYVFMGPPPMSMDIPWVVATVDDLVGGGVRMTIQNSATLGEQVVEKLWFNLNPVLDPTKLVFNYVGSSGSFEMPVIGKGVDRFKADGDGKYDILFAFATPWGLPHQYLPDCFSAGEWIAYDITGIPGLSASDFWYLSAPAGNIGPFYAAAYIPCATYICVPEPQILALAGLCACAFLVRRFRR